jgi:hypothetical protein
MTLPQVAQKLDAISNQSLKAHRQLSWLQVAATSKTNAKIALNAWRNLKCILMKTGEKSSFQNITGGTKPVLK